MAKGTASPLARPDAGNNQQLLLPNKSLAHASLPRGATVGIPSGSCVSDQQSTACVGSPGVTGKVTTYNRIGWCLNPYITRLAYLNQKSNLLNEP